MSPYLTPDVKNTHSIKKVLIATSLFVGSGFVHVAQAKVPQLSQADLYNLLQAEFAIERNNSQSAVATYKAEAFSKNSHKVFERAYQLSIENEEVPQTLAFVQKWQKKHPDYKPAWSYVAHLALQAHDYPLASRTLKQILKKDPEANLQEVLEDIYPTTLKDKKKLLMALDQLEKHDNSSLMVLKAGLLLEFGSLKNALREVNRAIKVEPYNVSYVILKADILRELGRDKELLTLLHKQRKESPDEQQLYIYEIRHHLRLYNSATDKKQKNRHLTKAWKLAVKASEEFADDPEINLLTALIGLDIGEYDKADMYLTMLIKEPEYYNRAFYYLGVSAEKQGDYQQARHYFSQIKQPKLALQATKRIVDFELQANNPDKAIDALVLLRSRFHQYAPMSYILQANILKQQGKTYKAKSLLQKHYQRYPNSDKLQFAYTQLLDNSSDYQVKFTILQKLHHNNPDNLNYKLHYGLIVLIKSPDDEQGQQLLREIIAIKTTDKRYNVKRYLTASNTLATIDLEKKKYQSVITAMQTAYQRQPNSTSGLLLLEAYRATGKNDLFKMLKQDLKKRFHHKGD